MGIYLGVIEHAIAGTITFYNYRPWHELRNGYWVQLGQEEKSELLPESLKGNINFSYNRNIQKQSDNMKRNYPERALVVFEFVPADLEDNKKPNTEERYLTGYRVNTDEMERRGKIRQPDADGFYQLITQDELETEFDLGSAVELRSMGINEGVSVFVDYNGFVAGPYTVRRKGSDWGAWYIKPKIKENKYTLRGFLREECRYQELYLGSRSMQEDRRHVVCPLASAETEVIDIISDKVLLDSFKESIENEFIGDGKIDISDSETLLHNFESSMLMGKELTDEIRANRLGRLREVLTSEADVGKTLSYLTDSFLKLLIKHKSSLSVNEFVMSVASDHPDLFDQMKSIKIVKEKIADLETKQDYLRQQNQELADEIAANKAMLKDEEAFERELSKLGERYHMRKSELDGITKALNVAGDISSLNDKLAEIKGEITYYEAHSNRMTNDARNLEAEFSDRIDNYHDKMVGISFDGWMANKMLQAASRWEAEETLRDYYKSVKSVNEISSVDMTPDRLTGYLCETVKTVRPQYDNNTIVNIAICIMQGFLTVFSGEPGSGKTSICNIMADVFGLNKIARQALQASSLDPDIRRYISVSVERGWTSKRDFIGYYNPLSKTFDKSNRRIYDALKMLDIERNSHHMNFPFVILLDEANLSPMEYYWADFMKVCDDLDNNALINLGEDNIFSIPETLHFVATINNDHTTEQLSPRLIDRAFIITLPHNTVISGGGQIDQERIIPVTWRTIKRAFLPNPDAVPELSPEVQKIYEAIILAHLRKKRINVSHRTDLTIRRYWSVASSRLESDEFGNDASIVALDYAVSQRILPRIAGNGEDFAKWLEELRSICAENNLIISARIVKDIIVRGNEQMKYYQFF